MKTVRVPVLMLASGGWMSLSVSSKYQKFWEAQARDVARVRGQLYWLAAELPPPESVSEVEAEVERG
jgi:hypothetical protein